MENYRYNKLNEYLKNKFGSRTLKICIDGSFTCPNRDGTKGFGGCIFCTEKGSGDHINIIKNFNNINEICISIKTQVQNYLTSTRAQRAENYIAYFQNFTNTYDTISNLEKKYSSALIDSRIKVLAIATRPDCITEEICKLLQKYKLTHEVWIELGLQTFNNKIGQEINRCYNTSEFENAVKLLNKYNIDVITHIIIGLPGETKQDIENTMNFLNTQKIQGLKIHSCYVTKNSVLAEMYKSDLYTPISLEYYIENTCFILSNLNPNIVIHKLSGDAPKDLLIAPKWNAHKKWILNGIDKYLKENDLYQGKYFKQ